MSPKSTGTGKKKASQKSTKRSGSAKSAASKRRPAPARKPAKAVKKPAKKPAKKAPPKKTAAKPKPVSGAKKAPPKAPSKAPSPPHGAAKPVAKAPPKAAPAPSAPTKPSPPTKPSAPPKPSAPSKASKPSAPSKASASTASSASSKASAPVAAPPRRPSPPRVAHDHDDFEELRVGPATRDPYPTAIPRETQPTAPRVPLPPPKGGKPLVGPPPPGPRPIATRPVHSEPLWDALPLPDEKAQLKRYYQGAQMPSPMGGFLEPLRVRTEDDGSGVVIFECSASSLRFALQIPAASRGEKKGVKDQQEAGEDPFCPRHEPPLKLNRVGPVLMCPLCGVRYGRV
jgi:hypothetical protein